MNSPQKRNHATAFSQPNNHRSRPSAPPAVPSFNASIAHLLPSKPAVTTNATSPPTPAQIQTPQTEGVLSKKNLLGLTPSHPDESASSDDEDEEIRLTGDLVKSSSLQWHDFSFEHNGQISSLRTAEEIQAWIAERKKRFPTVAQAEAAKKEREEQRRLRAIEKAERKKKFDAEKAEKKRKAEELRKATELAKQVAAKERQNKAMNKGTDKQSGKNDNAAPKAQAKADKLRKRAVKAEQALKRAEEALQAAREEQAEVQVQQNAAVTDPVDSVSVLATSEVLPPAKDPDPDETSSSGSSDSDLETDYNSSISISTTSENDSDNDSSSAEPETVNAKSSIFPSIPETASPKSQVRLRICRHFLKNKNCRHGSNCRFSHELDAYEKQVQGKASKRREKGKEPGASAMSRPQRRKGLYQVMVEKEEEEKRKKIAQAIFTLGKSGVLDEPTHQT